VIRGYGVMLLLAVVAAVALAARQAYRMGLDPEIIFSLAITVFVGGIIGARLFFVVQYWDRFQRETPLATLAEILKVTEGGLVVYGSFLGALVAGGWFLVRRGLPVLALADLVAPSMMLGLSIGRIGCLLNGCCYGGPCEHRWLAVTFPKDSPPYEQQRAEGELHGFRLTGREGAGVTIAEVLPGSAAEAAGLTAGTKVRAIDGGPTESLEVAHARLAKSDATVVLDTDRGPIRIAMADFPPRSRPVHPAQLYASVNAALLAWLLWAFYPFRRRDGEVFAWLLLLHPLARFLEEAIRSDEPGRFGTALSISQWLSLLIAAGGVALWWYVRRQPPGSALPVPPPQAA
jgi:phosphatidylglycerol:prolipoprotein diacylglycerol transferase